MSVVVNTEVNGNYEPSEGEIIEYGKWLGMNLPEDNPFLWIAREGLKAPLPENWKACQSEKGELYYFNFVSGQSIWDHPMDEHFKELFREEKTNPTPRSIAAGAKRKDSPSSAKKEGKHSKKKRNSDAPKKEPSPLQAPEDVPLPSTAIEEEQENAAMAPALKTVKTKKEIPKEMRIEFDSTPADKKSQVQHQHHQLQHQQPQLAPVGAPKLKFTATQSDSSDDDSSPKSKSKTSTDVAPERGPVTNLDAAVVRGGRGVKSLRMLSENNNRGSPSNERAASKLDAAEKAAVVEEKERLSAKSKDEIEKVRIHLERQRHQEEQALIAANAKALKDLRDKYRQEQQTQAHELKKRLEETAKEEQREIESNVKNSIEKTKKEIIAQRSADARRLREHYAEQLEQEKKKLTEELAEKLEAFSREQRGKAEARKESLLNTVREAERTFGSELHHFGSAMVRSYEDSYAAFSRSITSSQNDFALRSIQQKEEAQRELDEQLSQNKSEHNRALEAEKRKHQQELEEMGTTFAAEKAKLEEANRQELENTRRDAAQKIREETAAQEKESLVQAAASLRTTHQQELDVLKEELRQKAEEALKAELAELASVHKSRIASTAAQHEATTTSPRNHAPENKPYWRADGREGSAKPPSLDDNLLHSYGTNAPENNTTPRDTHTKDIKTAVTEALREMFAESPFTLPSPSRASLSASPMRQDVTAPQRLSLPSSSQANSDAAFARKHPKGIGFLFPTSFKDQHELVEGERQRVCEGRSFVETQRKNLEERRQQLKRTRHQWKQDVLAAKEEGVRSSSKRGQLLNKVRLALEDQARGLEHDQAILHESMSWLQSKEQRLVQLEQQIDEQERMRALGDNSVVNCSVDTAALVTGYFKPQRVSQVEALSRRQSAASAGNFTPFESPSTTPVFSSALSRIERRLDEVTSLINLQQAQSQQSLQSMPTSPQQQQHQQRQQQLGNRRISLTSPTTVQSHNRHRASRSHSKAVEVGQEIHTDPW